MRRKNAVSILTICLGTFLIAGFFGCAKDEEPVMEDRVAEETPAAPDQPEEVVYTRTDPGPWEGKEDGHVPVISYEKTDSGLDVTVTVNHEMNPDTPHYIMWIKLEDGEGTDLGEVPLTVNSEKAEAVFSLENIPGALKALEKCNLHGIWSAETEVILE